MAKQGPSPFDEAKDMAGDEAGHTSLAGIAFLGQADAFGKERQEAVDRMPDLHSAQATGSQQTTGGPQPQSEAAGRAGQSMDAALLAQFAERLALAGTQSGRTTMTLDPRQFHVAEVRIEGKAAEGLSITLQNHSDRHDGDRDEPQGSQPLEALRNRLLARAISVASIDRT